MEAAIENSEESDILDDDGRRAVDFTSNAGCIRLLRGQKQPRKSEKCSIFVTRLCINYQCILEYMFKKLLNVKFRKIKNQ
jgi:hypothetical protein